LLLCWVLFIEPSEWDFLLLRMGAGYAAAGRPLERGCRGTASPFFW
jgi:hypothetical protein